MFLNQVDPNLIFFLPIQKTKFLVRSKINIQIGLFMTLILHSFTK